MTKFGHGAKAISPDGVVFQHDQPSNVAGQYTFRSLTSVIIKIIKENEILIKRKPKLNVSTNVIAA